MTSKTAAVLGALLIAAVSPSAADPATPPSLLPRSFRPAPFVPGTYRSGGVKSRESYPTREIYDRESSTFFAELVFADNHELTACVSARVSSSHSTSQYTSGGESHSEDTSTFDRGFVGTWRPDGDDAIVEVTELKNTCTSVPKTAATLFTMRCQGLVADGTRHAIRCTVNGRMASTLERYIALRVRGDRAPWIIAGDQHGVAVNVSIRDQRLESADIKLAKRPLSRPSR